MKGLDHYQQNLVGILDAARKHVREAALDGAGIIRDAIRERAPLGETKKYRDSIVADVVGEYQDPNYVVVEVGGDRRKDHGFLSHMLEWGTAPHPIIKIHKDARRRKKYEDWVRRYHGNIPTHPGTAAQPHMRPGFEASHAEATQKCGLTFWARIKEAIKS